MPVDSSSITDLQESLVPIPSQPWRFGSAMVAFCALFGLVAFRLHHLQIEQAHTLAEMAEKQSVRTWVLQAPRGNIYDTHGIPLSVTAGTWSVYADPTYMDDRLRATVELSRLLGIDRDLLRRQFEAHVNGRRLSKGISDERAESVRQLKLAGIYVRREFSRLYPEGSIAPHVLGFVLDDGNGGGGIEQSFNKDLAGVSGKESYAVDALGQPFIINEDSLPARPGANVQLTIDSIIQQELEAQIEAAVERHKCKNACGIIMRPGTGEILAMASWPRFDLKNRTDIERDSLRNNAIAFVYEPGSTMKPLVAGAAVAEGLTNWHETIFCENGCWTFRVGKSARTIKDHSYDHGGHGNLTVTDGIAMSDNILMAKLGVRLGVERLYQWVSHFNFGRKTGINIPGEDAGIVLPRKQWTILGSCLSIPIGHEIAVTPLQMAMAHAAIANGGTWQSPRIVKRVYRHDAEADTDYELPMPSLAQPRQAYTATDAARIQEAMNHTMTDEHGTGHGAELDGYSCAGKTGTAEKLVNGHYSNEHHVGSFVCWAPASPTVAPEVLALVVIDDAQANGHYGAQTAAPVVQRLLQFSLEYLQVPKDKPATAEPAERDD